MPAHASAAVPWALLLQSAAVLNALLLALVLLVAPRLRRTRGRIQFAGLLLTFAISLALFTAMDSAWIAVTSTAVGLEYLAALAGGALLVAFTRIALHAGAPTAAGQSIYALPLLGALLLLSGSPLVLTEAALMATIAFQLFCSGLSTWTFVRTDQARPRYLAALLIGVWALHLVQLLRMAFPQVTWLFDAVPMIAATLMISLSVLINSDSRSWKAMVASPAAPSTGPDLSVIREHLVRDRAFCECRYSLQQLADSVGVNARQLSALLAQQGTSFYQLLHEERIALARQLLRDPAEQRSSVEAIGLEVGYRSRSTFYEAFRKATGMSPAEFRRRQGAESSD